jgi:hypothetical protein
MQGVHRVIQSLFPFDVEEHELLLPPVGNGRKRKTSYSSLPLPLVCFD